MELEQLTQFCKIAYYGSFISVVRPAHIYQPSRPIRKSATLLIVSAMRFGTPKSDKSFECRHWTKAHRSAPLPSLFRFS
jgi:hypothetical protein